MEDKELEELGEELFNSLYNDIGISEDTYNKCLKLIRLYKSNKTRRKTMRQMIRNYQKKYGEE